MIAIYTQQKSSGFALLLTLVVVSVVLAIGLSLLEVTLKQLVLSGTGRDSEIAFHAAYTGIECGEYTAKIKTKKDELLGGSAPSLNWCVSGSNVSGTYDSTNPANVHKASYEIDWPSGGKCTKVDIYLLDATGGQFSHNFGYFGTKICKDKRVCSLVFSRGYNRACSDTDSIRAIEREVVSEF